MSPYKNKIKIKNKRVTLGELDSNLKRLICLTGMKYHGKHIPDNPMIRIWLSDALKVWCDDNIENREWDHENKENSAEEYTFCFKREQDAFWFALKWA